MKTTTKTNTNEKEDKLLEKINKDLNKEFVELKVLSSSFRNQVIQFQKKTESIRHIFDSFILNLLTNTISVV